MGQMRTWNHPAVCQTANHCIEGDTFEFKKMGERGK